MTNNNIGIVTIHALVNSKCLESAGRELQERVATHPTVIDIFRVNSTLPEVLVRAVETGVYEQGDFCQQFHFTTTTPQGGDTFHTVVETAST